MAAQTLITITHGTEANATAGEMMSVDNGSKAILANKLQNFFSGASGGVKAATVAISTNGGDAVAASGTVTLSSFVADDTVTVGLQVFTAKVSPSGANQFALGASDTAAAAALAAKINAHTSLLNVVTATSALGVVTVTSAVTGLIGNHLGIAISAHGSVSGSGKLASGAAPTSIKAIATYTY